MKRTLRLLVLTSSCICPPLGAEALADDFDIDPVAAPTAGSGTGSSSGQTIKVNEVTFGIGGISGARAMSGRFDGLDKSGVFTTGSLHLLHRNTEDLNDGSYAELEGDGLNVTQHTLAPSASLSLRAGSQGVWGLDLSYEGTPYAESDNFKTLFTTSGTLQNGLATRSISTTASTGAAVVNKYLATVDVGTRRDKFEGKANYSGLEDWVFSSDVQHEHKQGSKINSMMFLSTSNYAAFAEPVDYDTDKVSVSGAYTGQNLQTQLSYVFSSFHDNQMQFNVLSPFSGTVRTGYVTSQYSLPPDNMEHQIKGSLGYSLTPGTHLAMNARYGLQLQNSAYTANYYNDYAVAASSKGTGNSAYDGTIQNMYANAVLTSRPTKDLNLKAAYSVDDRDNMGRTYKLTAYRADGTAAFNGNGSYSSPAPYSFLFQKANLEAGYKLTHANKLTVDYLLDDRYRDYSVTNHNRENSLGAQLKTNITPELTNSFGISQGRRAATAYNGNAGWNAMSRTVTAESNLGQYNYAARVRDEVKDSLTWAPGPDLSMGTTFRYTMDNYPSTFFGVTSNRAISGGPDINATLLPGVTGHLFYTYELNSIGMMEWTGNSTSSVMWHLQNRDEVHTIGASSQWKLNDHLTLSFEDTYSLGNTAFDEASWLYGTYSATTGTAVSLPTAHSVTNMLKLNGEYELENGLYFGLTGIWQRYLNQDYLLSEAASSSANQTSTSTESVDGNGSYSVKALIATMRMTW